MNYHAQLERAVHRMWNGTGIASSLLLPLSWLTRLAVAYKARRYRKQPARVWHAPVPVVVVGNIFVGGTGKTPVVMALVDALQERGWHPGVISRGYGVHIGTQARCGQGTLDPAQFGDEPALIARTTGVPVAVHPSRPAAARALLRHNPRIDVIVADDGLQHLALGRDAEIIVQDDRGVGNGRLLPAGPLREPAKKLTEVDVVVTHSYQAPNNPASFQERSFQATVDSSQTRHTPAQVGMALVPHDVIHVNSGQSQPWDTWLQDHRDMPLSAVAAIGHPERFFAMLRRHGLPLAQTLALPDHTAYSTSTFDTIATETILITTKDAIKCKNLQDDRLWAVRVTPRFSDTGWLDTLHNTLLGAARHRSQARTTAQR